MSAEFDLDDVETKESVLARIRDVEQRLAKVRNLADAIAALESAGTVMSPEELHRLICTASRINAHPFDVETDLAHEWYSAYAAWKDWENEP